MNNLSKTHSGGGIFNNGELIISGDNSLIYNNNAEKNGENNSSNFLVNISLKSRILCTFIEFLTASSIDFFNSLAE